MQIPQQCETLLQQLVAEAKAIGERNADECGAPGGGRISAGHFPIIIAAELMEDLITVSAPSLCSSTRRCHCGWTDEVCRKIQGICEGNERLLLVVKIELIVRLIQVGSAALQYSQQLVAM